MTKAIRRWIAYLLIALLNLQPAIAATVTISTTPLATNNGSNILANLLFTLDSSGSMDWDYLPDYVNDTNKCLPHTTGSGTTTQCQYGEPPFAAGGLKGFNGVAYDPNLRYKEGLKYDGTAVIASTAGSSSPYTMNVASVPRDAYGAQSSSPTNCNVNGSYNCDLTTGITDQQFCNPNGVCLRNGADSTGANLVAGTTFQGRAMAAGQFPYRTTNTNSSATIFGLPEMMTIGTFSRSSTTVTVTTIEPHGMVVGDVLYVTGTGQSGVDLNAVTVTTSANATTLTYTSTSSGSVSARAGSFRKHSTGSFTRSSSTVTATATGHGLVTGDIITVNSANAGFTNASTSVTVVDANTFRYTSGSSGTITATAGTWVRTGLYNSSTTVYGPPVAYHIEAREFCADENLTNCMEDTTASFVRSGTTVTVTSPAHGLTSNPVSTVDVVSGNASLSTTAAIVSVVNANTFTYQMTGSASVGTTSATWLRNGFTFPAYVRFCQSQAQAMSPGSIGDASGTPRCRGRAVLTGSPTYTWSRYGWFFRDTIQPSVGSYAKRPDRTDCATAPTCTYTEEIQNYARWFSYYSTRMMMMKSAAGRAFQPFISNPSASPPVNDKVRIGFININPFFAAGSGSASSTIRPENYLKIDAFNTTQAQSWYSKFYAQAPNQSTPLREALSRAGWIFSGQLNQGLTAGIPVADDPVQNSCQKNFTIMTTDGYWNGNAGQDINGNTGLNTDNINNLVISPYTSPMSDRTATATFDGGIGSVTATSTPTTQVEQNICKGTSNTTFSTSPQTVCGCVAGQHRIEQRTLVTNQVVVQNSNGTTSTTNQVGTPAFVDITPCSAVVITTAVTPTITVEQQLVQAASLTTFAGGAATNVNGVCSAGQQQIIERTKTVNSTVVTTDGVTAAPVSTTSYAFAFQGTCTTHLIVTNSTAKTETIAQTVTGAGATGFAAVNGLNTDSFGTSRNTIGTCGANFAQVITRTTTYNSVTSTDNGVAQAGSTNSTTYSFAYGACQGLTSTTVVRLKETSYFVGASPLAGGLGSGNTNFPTEQNGADAPDGVAWSCTNSGVTGRRIQLRRISYYQDTQTSVGGGAVSHSYGANLTGGFASTTATSVACGTGTSATVPATTVTVDATISGPTVTGQPTASPLATQTVTGTTTTTTTGAQPAPSTTSTTTTATTTSSTGTPLSITQSPNPSNPSVGTATTGLVPGGYGDTLADVAMYYYRTDLRGGTDYRGGSTGPSFNLGGTGTVDVSANNIPVKQGAVDFVTHQHMVTYTVGLADGYMRYQSDYSSVNSGDYYAIKQGTNNGCFWVTGTCDWPQPVADTASALDDLWHAAVNGRGQYYQALNADALAAGLNGALTAVSAQLAAAAASATSSPNVTQSDNQIFSTLYETDTWSGKVFAQTIDVQNGNVNAAHTWEADTQLLLKVGNATDTRALWTFDAGVTPSATKLKAFSWASLSGTEQGYFTNKCTPSSNMNQCSGLAGGSLTTANDGSSLVGYLRGQKGNEGAIFRHRVYTDLIAQVNYETVLGDTISAVPLYVRNAKFSYTDAVTPSYGTFVTTLASRSARVYIGANDGFLHAFEADTGNESWAYTPRFLMPNFYKLADTGYSTKHQYFVDGSAETGDVYDTATSTWKTILVGGVAGGGRGFYALDITDPVNPKGLWEFCSDSTLCAKNDANLGLSYGNPVIGKRPSDGKWVVVVTSGLNNASTGDGVGRFYILDAITGQILNTVSTGVGSSTTPSGLMKQAAYLDNPATDASIKYVYAGDQLGNVWRLDMATTTPTVMHVASLKDGSDRAQPITTRPLLTHQGTNRIIIVGTGRFLGAPDLTDPTAASGIAWQQSVYVFKDLDSDYAATYSKLRADPKMGVQTLSYISSTTAGASNNPVDLTSATYDGWYMDFAPTFSGVVQNPGEGVNLIDPKIVLGTLDVTTNAPSQGASSCEVGGSSFSYSLDYSTGKAVATSTGGVARRSLGGTIAVGVAIIQLPDGSIKNITTDTTGTKTTSDVPTASSGSAVKRFSYRIR